MKSIFCYFAALYLLLYPFTAYPTSLPRPSTADSLPRMWEVTGTAKNGHPLKFYILGVSHNGLDPEYDDYLAKKIMPIFNRADILSYEGAVLTPLLTAACPAPLASTSANLDMIRAARERMQIAQKKLLEKTQPTPKLIGATKKEVKDWERDKDEIRSTTAKEMVDSYSEFGLVWGMAQIYFDMDEDGGYRNVPPNKINAAINAAKKTMGYKGEVRIRAPIVDYLKQSRPSIPVESIDVPQDFLDSYCTPGTDREKLFQNGFNHWDIKFNPHKLAGLYKIKINGDIALTHSLKRQKLTGTLMSDIDEYSAYVCTRNPRWLNKMMSNNGAQVKFYALGLGHLLPRADRKHSCDDLLTMLRNAGMSVVLIT